MTATQLAPATLAPATRSRAALAVPAIAYLAVRLLGTLLLWGMDSLQRIPLNLHRWDGDWYLHIAQFGYHGAAAGMVDAHGNPSPDGAMAFFPGYPLLVRAVATVSGDYVIAAVVVSTAAGVIGAYGVARLAARYGRRTQLVAVVLTAAAPMSVVYSMAYPEALLVALVAWTLVGVQERRWWLVAPCIVAAGLVSPMAAPLIPVVIVSAGLDVYRGRWGAAVAAMAAPTGFLGYLLWVHQMTPGGYFAITQAGWGNHADFGWTTARWVYRALLLSPSAYIVIVAALIVAAVPLLWWARKRLPWQTWVYCVLVFALTYGSGGLPQDRVRLLLSAFPLLIPLAAGIADGNMRRLIGWTTAVAVAGLWFGAYSLTIWNHAI
jgi:hypothetical protein